MRNPYWIIWMNVFKMEKFTWVILIFKHLKLMKINCDYYNFYQFLCFQTYASNVLIALNPFKILTIYMGQSKCPNITAINHLRMYRTFMPSVIIIFFYLIRFIYLEYYLFLTIIWIFSQESAGKFKDFKKIPINFIHGCHWSWQDHNWKSYRWVLNSEKFTKYLHRMFDNWSIW